MDLTLPAPRRGTVTWLWRRELDRYPGKVMRLANLAIVVLTTVVLYYQFYLAGSLAAGTSGHNGIIPDLNMSFVAYVNIGVGAAVFGALSSFFAGAADRFGRANIVVVGVLLTALLCLVGIPAVHSTAAYAAVFIAIGFVEGFVLVATPALVRDFSPQVGRAQAMAFWAIGPVLGSLVVSVIVSNSSDSTPWRHQYAISGVIGLAVFLLAAVGLRELAPGLRDQIMVSERDRALVEARAKGLDVEAGQKRPIRQMLRFDIIGSAFAISVFLLIYFVSVAFLPLFFQTVFGYSQSKANALGNWFWTFDAVGLVVIGFLSDRLRVRKPFMLIGAIGAVVFTAIFATKATDSGTSYSTFVVLLVLLSLFLGVAYAPWMASFTETVEARNPMLTATGLGLWGMVIRAVVAVAIFILPHVVTNVTTLVAHGGRVQELAAGQDPTLTPAQNATVRQVVADPAIVPKVQSLATTYTAQVATAQKLTPSTVAALRATPGDQAVQVRALSEISGESAADVGRVAALNAQYRGQFATAPAADRSFLQTHAAPVQAASAQLAALGKVPPADLAYLQKYGPALRDPKVAAALTYLKKEAPAVAKAAADAPKQWQHYFWITVGGEILFIPFIFLMVGYWDPRKARQKAREHDAWVETELAELRRNAPAEI